jgi:Leucine-rich repeat (LRR) protein
MRPKYQTRANRAEEQVLAMLKSEKNIQKPWSLVSHSLENRTLQTTASEAAIIFNHEASLRPGYEQKDETVYVPNLFIKLSGTDEAFSVFQNRQELQKRDNLFVFDSFKSFSENDINERSYESFLKGELLQKEEFLSSDAFNYSFLRREYQELYVDKVNEILSSKRDFFIGRGLNLTDNQILSNLCQINESFFHAFNQFDFQFHPPAVIITNKGKEKPNVNQALTLILLNLLGFDVVIHSPDGHADIENILNPDVYCLFYGDGLKYPRPVKWMYKLRYVAAGAIIVVGLATSGFLKPLLFTNNDPPPIIQSAIPTTITYQEPDPTPAPNISELPVIDNLPVEDPTLDNIDPPDSAQNNNGALEFNDKALEDGLRKVLKKETGDIYANEISILSSIRFIGPYAGGPDWVFLNGYSPDAYYDIHNIAHYDEGEIKDLSVFGRVPYVGHLEVSWQKGINLESLKGSKLTGLVLIHDNITDISALASIYNLRYLDLASNNISDITPLSDLPLNTLEVRYNHITNIEPLAKMEELQNLTLESNPIKDITPLYKLTNLNRLTILGVQISDFGFLKNMTQLRNLNLENTGFTDVSILEDHTNLEILFLSNNNISDISSLKNLKMLQHLDISMTRIRDISVLKELPNLRTINMFGVTLEDESILRELKNVEVRR